MMAQLPTVDVLPDGEEREFDRLDAAMLYYHEDAERTVTDDGITVTVETVDVDGNDLVLTYKLNQIFVEVAEYDMPDEEVEFTTAPTSTERPMVYGDPDEEADDAEIIFDGEPLTRERGDFSPVWDRADHIEAEEDYITARGLDDSQDPIPNQYDANWLLVEAAYADAPEDPFFRHPKYNPEEEN